MFKFTLYMKTSLTLNWWSPLSKLLQHLSIRVITPHAVHCNTVITVPVSSLQLHCRASEVQRSCLICPVHTCAQNQTQKRVSKSWLSSTMAAEHLLLQRSSLDITIENFILYKKKKKTWSIKTPELSESPSLTLSFRVTGAAVIRVISDPDLVEWYLGRVHGLWDNCQGSYNPGPVEKEIWKTGREKRRGWIWALPWSSPEIHLYNLNIN